MSHLDDAEAARAYARGRVGRQVNLKPALPGANWEVQQYEAKLLHGNLRKEQGADAFGTWGMPQICGFGQKVEAVGIGNCQELCAVACNFLSQRRVASFHACIFEPPADHVFVVIGENPVKGSFPFSFNNWSADAAICDAWADIACLARDYPTRWRDRMHQWSGQKEIQTGVEKGASFMADGKETKLKAGVWIDAGQWADEPARHNKICIASSGQEGTNKCCYITTAACAAVGLAEDARELQLLRWFRDHVLLETEDGRRYVDRYYGTAPQVLVEIDRLPDPRAVYRRIYERGVLPAVAAIESGHYARALGILQQFVDRGWASA